jgi:hypothetical protein
MMGVKVSPRVRLVTVTAYIPVLSLACTFMALKTALKPRPVNSANWQKRVADFIVFAPLEYMLYLLRLLYCATNILLADTTSMASKTHVVVTHKSQFGHSSDDILCKQRGTAEVDF